MDRRQLLDRAARNGDERVLLAHILDKCEQSRNRNIPSATDFLSPAEQRSAQDLLHAAAIHDGYAFCGANAWRTEKIQSVRELIASLRKEYESFSLRDRLFPNKG